MKTKIYKSSERGITKNSWLQSFHSFSFAEYYDEDKMGAGVLRVLNDDVIKPQSGFPPHSHRDMEIVTIILKGKLTHEDTIGNSGNKETISENEIQVMSAGTGVTHSEYNNEKDESVELLQIWLTPNKKNLIPRYEQKVFPDLEYNGEWRTIVSPNLQNTLHIAQEAYFSLTNLKKNENIPYKFFDNEHGAFVFIIEGEITIENIKLGYRDAVYVTETNHFLLQSIKKSFVLVIEVPQK